MNSDHPPPAAPERPFSRPRRLQLFWISLLGGALVRGIGATLRYRVEDWENFQRLKAAGRPVIYSFWHNQIFAATHFWRKRNITVITSRHFDGEYIARIIARFGYRSARGSSRRGAAAALLQLKRCLERGEDVAFTVDGPRGPIYRVKPGPIWLSRKTGAAIVPFHIEPRRFWTLRSWDRFRIPRPFSPVLVKIGQPLVVTGPAREEVWLDRYQQEMDRIRDHCEAAGPKGAEPAALQRSITRTGR